MANLSLNDAYKLKDLWNFSYKLNKVNLTLKGHSRGSERSGFLIPELSLYFDAGIQSPYNPEYIFVTHCHSDHSNELYSLISYISKSKTKKPITCVPNGHKQLFINDVFSAFQRSLGNSKARCPYVIQGVEHNAILPITNGNNKYFVKVYELDHSVLAYGYGLFQTRTKLKSEYLDLNKDEIIKLRKNKVVITEEKVYPQIVYLCDTTTKIFTSSPEVLTFPYVVVECTFLYDYEKEKVKKHIHWDDIKDIIINNQQCMFILIHFSMRYSQDEITAFFDKEREQEKENLNNIYIWLN